MRFFLTEEMFKDVHASLAERKGAELKQLANEFGIDFRESGFHNESGSLVVEADISRSTPARVYEFCEMLGIPRADFSTARDLGVYAGGTRNPVALQMAEAFSQGAIDKTMLEQNLPEELFQRSQDIINAVLDASDRQYAEHGDVLDERAVAVMKQYGIAVPDVDRSFLDPAPPKPFDKLSGEWENYADEDPLGIPAAQQWDGF